LNRVSGLSFVSLDYLDAFAFIEDSTDTALYFDYCHLFLSFRFCFFTLVVTNDMIGIRAVGMPTRPKAGEHRLAVKDWNCKGSLVKISLPRDTLLGPILDNQGSVHPAGLALEVFSLSLLRVNFPSRSASAT
jgi:hypothetical protein